MQTAHLASLVRHDNSQAARQLEGGTKVRPDNLPEVVFLAVDPSRDQQSLARYVGHFHPDFTGITGATSNVDTLL